MDVKSDEITNTGYVMPPLKLINDNTSSALGSSDGLPPRMIVSNLTASWTHVSMLSCVC